MRYFDAYIQLVIYIVIIIALNVNKVITDSWTALSFVVLVVISILYFNLINVFRIKGWVNPILKLSIILIKLDGVEKVSETKRIIKYLNEEFGSFVVKIKLKFYKKQLKIEQNIHEICDRIKNNSSTKDKVRIVQHLIKLALSDRLLTDQELEFLEKVTKKIGLPKITLKAILRLHIYVTEEDIRKQKLNKNYVNSSLSKALSILGLEPKASKEEIKDAYRSLVMIYHPDKLKKGERYKEQAKIKFQAINDAYQYLKKELN
ncbi:DnaJ domain-containing protein [Flavobacteriales bacterium]|nr:DnaJ domain-containing protein [Flavobacteriales bacterium]